MFPRLARIIFLCLTASLQATAQSESLQCLDAEDPIQALVVRGIESMYLNADSSEVSLRLGLSLAMDKADNLTLNLARYEIANLYFHMLGKNPEALQLMHQALPGILATDCQTMWGYAHMLTGKIYADMAVHYDSALYHFQRAEQLNNTLGKTYRNWQVHHNLAMIYEDIHDLPLATKYFNLALDTVRTGGRRMDYGYVLNEVMQFYYHANLIQEFADLQEEYITYRTGGEMPGSETSMHAALFFNEEMPDDAQEEMLISFLPYHKKSGNVNSLVMIHLFLADISEKKGNRAKARDYLISGLQYRDKTNSSGRLEFLTRLKVLEKNSGNFQQALAYANEELALRDSILQRENLARVHDLEIQYETDKKEQQIALLSSQNELQDLRMEAARRTARRNILIAALLIALLAIIALASYYALYNKRILSKTLEENNKVISKALKEKELLLKEIHHRVKNNLQVVSSLLYLQSEYIEDNTAQKALQDGRNRVHTMALIHKNLYQEDNLTGIDMREYLENLANSLVGSYSVSPTEIQIKTDIESLFLDVDTVIPLALIINELLSNSLKHAFIGRTKGEVALKLHRENDELLLSVADDGIGLTEGFRPEHSHSFGFELIRLFAEKLKATTEIHNSNGLKFNMRIKKFKIA